jgi:2-keto-3-deoxy-L-arabinonate dehydratase
MTTPDLYTGIHAVLYALFREDESIDHDAMTHQVEYCLEAGCHGITVLGLATEVQKLSLAERKALVKQVSSATRSRVPFSVTIAGNSVAEQIELAEYAQDHGADWLILQPPMVGIYGADVYLEFFERVANSISLPVAVQNAPQYLGRALSAEDLTRLHSLCPNLSCVKSEDSALGVQRIVNITDGALHILGGRGGLELTDSLRAGCEGFVLAPDVVPIAVKIFNTWQEGRHEEAEQLYTQAVPAITFVMQSLEHLITYGKRIFAANAGFEVYDRSPCLAPTEFGLALTEQWAVHMSNVGKAASELELES